MRCRINFTDDTVKNQTPKFMDLGFSTTNPLYESSGVSTPDTIIRRITDGFHWSASTHVFDEVTALGIIEAKSDYEYNYKTEFKIWK